MAAMRVEKTIAALGREVRVRELTVAEIRRWLADVSTPSGEIDVADQLLFEDVALSELQRMTDLTDAEIGEAAPSELRPILALCREVNRDFFVLRNRLMVIGEQKMATGSVS